MKKLAFTFAIALLALVHCAAADLWLTDVAKAQAKAKEGNKAVLLDFTGSDWCPYCIKLRQEVFESAEFKEFAEKNLSLVDVDFPKKKKLSRKQGAANDKLLDKYEVKAYPTVILLDKDGKELGREIDYEGIGAKAYIAKLQAILDKK